MWLLCNCNIYLFIITIVIYIPHDYPVRRLKQWSRRYNDLQALRNSLWLSTVRIWRARYHAHLYDRRALSQLCTLVYVSIYLSLVRPIALTRTIDNLKQACSVGAHKLVRLGKTANHLPYLSHRYCTEPSSYHNVINDSGTYSMLFI